METMNPFISELQREILSYNLKSFLSNNPEHEYLFSLDNSLLELAENYGLLYHKGITLDKYSKMNKTELLSEASELGYINVVSFITQQNKIVEYEFTKNDYNMAMVRAAEEGRIEIVKILLGLGADDYNFTMANAAQGGHVEIVKMMLKLGANNYNWTMLFAGERGRIKIVKMMLRRGANNYNLVMENAAEGGHIEIVKLMLELGANNYNEAMFYAEEVGHIEIVNLIKSYM